MEKLEEEANEADKSNATTMVISPEKIADVLKSIYKFGGFFPERASGIGFKWREQTGELLFILEVPFEHHKSKWLVKDKPCVHAKDLPKFYQLKGKVNH